MIKRVVIATSLCIAICFLSAFSTQGLSLNNVKLEVKSPFVDLKEPVSYIDENMPKTMLIAFDGKEYSATYLNTKYWHQYVADEKHNFFFDINTGEFHSYAYYDYECEKDSSINEESYIEQAKLLLKQYVDIELYDVEISDAGTRGYMLTFTRWFDDVKLPGLCTVGIAYDGTVVSCSIVEKDHLDITSEIETKVKFLTSPQAEQIVLNKAKEINNSSLAPFYIESKYVSLNDEGEISVSFTVCSQSELWNGYQLPYIVLTYKE